MIISTQSLVNHQCQQILREQENWIMSLITGLAHKTPIWTKISTMFSRLQQFTGVDFIKKDPLVRQYYLFGLPNDVSCLIHIN